MEKLVFLVLAFIGITGVLNGFFLFFYLFFAHSKKNPSDRYLSFLALFMTLRMTKSIISSLIPVHFLTIHIGLAAFACVGPSLFLYIRKSINPRMKFSVIEALHFVPAALVLLCAFLPYSQDDPIWNLRYNIIMFHILAYLVITVLHFLRNKDRLDALPYKKSWYVFLISSVSMIWLSYGATWWIGILPYLSASFLFCIFVYMILFLSLKRKQLNESFEKYRNSLLSKDDSILLSRKLMILMDNSKLFLDNDLSLSKLASHANTKPHLLSQVINENFNNNFFDFINSYRIDEVKERLVSDKYANLTIAAIAYECGFNSVSSFNTAFRKKEKISPGKYRDKYFSSLKKSG